MSPTLTRDLTLYVAECDDGTGSSIYVYGPTGPSFNSFQITLDSQPYSSKTNGIYNASSTVTTTSILLFYATQLDPASHHQITLTNQVDGATLAVDYFVVSSAQTQPGQNPVWPGGSGQAVRGSDTSGALVGGILGGLLAAVSPILPHLRNVGRMQLIPCTSSSYSWLSCFGDGSRKAEKGISG